MNRIISFLLFVLMVAPVTAQTRKESSNSLLWRITGNGLSKPSYLFGTIHLTDKKVFFLGDSVYNAIERSEGFAAELDLNSIGVEMINRFMKEEQERNAVEAVKVKDVVGPDVWQRYKTALAEKFGKKAENITVEDLDEMSEALENEVFQSGEMPTFLDAHLFGIAKKKGKWVGGIEEIDDQMEHIDNFKNIEEKIQTALYDEEYYRDGLKWMINMYINQRLDSIDALMYREQSGEKDYIMIKRNLKMARRMDSLSSMRSTFFAVGAAHLPGDSGVISLLRSMGFQVSPVVYSKRIDPSKYVIKSSDEVWFPVDIKDSAYFLRMPGIASRFEMLESYGLHTKLFFDISFMKMYMTMSLEIGEERKKLGADSLFNELKRRYADKGTNVKEKNITINGVKGKELRFKNSDGDFIMQVFLPGMERMVLNAIMTLKEQSLIDDDNKKFFQSFVVNANSKTPIKVESTWHSYTNQTQAFSIEFPSKPIENKDVRSEEGKIVHTYEAVDLRSQVFYGITISSIKEGLYLAISDSAHFLGLAQNMRSRFEKISIVDSSLFSFSGFPACKFLINATSEGAEIVLNILSVLRGNRNYYLFSLYQPGETGKINSEKYLNSFKLLPMNYADWKTEYSKDKSFSTSSPFSFRKNSTFDDTEMYANSERTIVYDTLASHSMFIDRFTLPAWYWYISDSALLRDRVKRYVDWNDSLIEYKTTVKGKTKEAEFLIVKPQQTTIKKGKIILSGNEMYELYGYLAQEDLDKYYYKFFDDFKVLKEGLSFDITKIKVKELEETIRKNNKRDIEEVKLWWNDLSLEENELPLLRSLMMKVYPDFDSTYETSLNWRIIQKIISLDTNNHTVDFIRNNYKNISPENKKIKPLLVSYLADIPTKESYSLIREMVGDESYPTDINMYFYLPLYDSLELTATLYPEILKLTASEYFVNQICGVTTTLIDSNLLQKDILKNQEKRFITLAKKVVSETGKDDEVYRYYDLARILGILNTPESNKLLTQFSKYSDREMRFQTLLAMLKNNLPVDPKTIYTLASTDEYRYNLYEALRESKKLSLFPLDYLSQGKLGFSKLYTDNNDEEYPLIITNAGSKTILYKGKQQKVYLYKVLESSEYDYLAGEKDLTYYLAVAGPFSTNTKDCYSSHELTGIYWTEEFDKNKLDALLKKYIESLNEK